MSASGNILREDEVLTVVEQNLGRTDLRLNGFRLKPASDEPAGFLGELYRLTVEVAVDDEIQTLVYFVKKLPTAIPEHLDYALKTRAFYKETEIYKTLVVDLRTANPAKWCPDYFYSRGSDLFVLEDLTAAGYYMYPERCLMDEDHLKATLKALAAMHASSFVFEEKFNRGEIRTRSPGFKKSGAGRTTIGEVYSHLTFETEASDEKGHPGNTYHEAGIKAPVKIVDLLPDYSLEEKKVIKEKLPDVLRRFLQLVKTSDRFKNVFLHGDLWSNNLLFRKEESGKVRDALIIDFQLARYAPPAHDVLMFLHLVQDNAFLNKRRNEMLEFYFDAFSQQLDRNSLRVRDVLPWEEFLSSCDFYKDLGLLCKPFYFQLILAPPEITTKFLSSPDLFIRTFLVDRTDMVVECFLSDSIYRTRMTEALKDVVGKFILV